MEQKNIDRLDKPLESKQTEFAVFCIENTAERLNISGADVVTELERTDGIRTFLYPSYEALHTQGKEYIIDEILNYIHQHNPSFAQHNTQK